MIIRHMLEMEEITPVKAVTGNTFPLKLMTADDIDSFMVSMYSIAYMIMGIKMVSFHAFLRTERNVTIFLRFLVISTTLVLPYVLCTCYLPKAVIVWFLTTLSHNLNDSQH